MGWVMGFDCVPAAGTRLAATEDASSRGLGAALGGMRGMVEYELLSCLNAYIHSGNESAIS